MISESAKVTLEPSALMLQSGGDTGEAVATVRNTSEVLDQFDIEIEGLERTWYTVHAPSVGLFPGDNSEVRISFHPPKRIDIRAGDYPFLVKAVSQVDKARGGSAKGFVKIQPFAVFKAEISPQRATGRRGGTFRVVVSNSGSVDLSLDMKAADREKGCRFDINPETLVVAPGEKATAAVHAHPNRGWITGPPKPYDFTVTVAPQGARGDVKAVNGTFLHRPLLRSWRPLTGLFKTIIILALLAAGFGFALNLGGGVSGYQRGITKLWEQARGLVAGESATQTGSQGGTQTTTSGGIPTFTGGFRIMHDADPQLVGDPLENAHYDMSGNGYQNTKSGTLFWLKETNTVYFFGKEGLYVYRDGRTRMIDAAR
jgi:hypothetical protein